MLHMWGGPESGMSQADGKVSGKCDANADKYLGKYGQVLNSCREIAK